MEQRTDGKNRKEQQVIDINPTISIMILTVNGLYVLIKKQRLLD